MTHFKIVIQALVIGFTFAAKADVCPMEIKSIAKWKMSNGNQLVVCEWGKYEDIGKDSYKGWINLYKLGGKEPEPYIKEPQTEMPSEFFVFGIKKINSGEIKITRYIDGGDDTPATEVSINCKSKQCLASKEKCLTPPRSGGDSESIEVVKAIVSGKKKIDDVEDYDTTLAKVIQSALGGNKIAMNLIMNTSESKLHVDGHTAEVLHDGRQIIRLLKELKCLK